MTDSAGTKAVLVSHINGDADLLESWFNYYQSLGVARFHLIVHGTAEENAQLFKIKDRFPIIFEESYRGSFDSEEKKKHLNALLARMSGEWVMLVDSDEFVELPYENIPKTIQMLRFEGANTLFAPMMQRLNADGSLIDLGAGEDPSRVFPLCSPDLYLRMGVSASIFKYPLFYCTEATALLDGGNHNSPNGSQTILSSLQGVTHHYKFRRCVLQRLDARIHSTHPWRHESVLFQRYLENHSNRLPTTGSFAYSRKILFRKSFLRNFPASKIAALTARIHWRQRRFAKSFFAASCAVIMRPALVGRVVKPVMRQSADKIKREYSRFGKRGLVVIGMANLLRKPLLMTVRTPFLAYPVHLRARTTDLRTFEDVVLRGQYQYDCRCHPKVIVDVGANIGLASVYFATRFPDARIFAIEPEAENFGLLQKNVRPYKNVQPIRAALWSSDTRVELIDTGEGSWAFQVRESLNGAVPAITLSTLLRQYSISSADVVKIDIEGAEREVFKGTPDWISKVGLLMIELHDRFKPGCSEAVRAAVGDRSSWTRGEVHFFVSAASESYSHSDAPAQLNRA
jgi:FkbM family methyltransferase